MRYKNSELGLLPEDWELVPLGDLLYIKGRIGWKGLKKDEYLSDGFAIINGEQIKNDMVDWKNVGRIPKERYEESPEIMLEEGDILMTKDGTIGKTAYIEKLKEPATVASGVFVIRENSDRLCQKYLYSYFGSHFFKNLIRTRTEGSVIPHLYQRDFKELLIPLPKKEEQIAIGNLLFSIKKKIKILEKENDTLYRLANTLFKGWFVDFQNSDKKQMQPSIIGNIPNGWEIAPLQNCLIHIIDNRGKTPKFLKEGIPALSAKFVKNGQIINQEKFNYISEELFKQSEKLNVGDIIMTSEAPLGELFFIADNTTYYPAQRVFALRADTSKISPEYLYLWLNSRWGKYFIKRRGTGSTVQGIKQSELKLIEVLVPSKEVLDTINPVFKNIFQKRETNFQEIKILKKLRKMLLPKLMTGQLRVKI